MCHVPQRPDLRAQHPLPQHPNTHPHTHVPAGVAGYYRGLRTKVVQSVLAAALLFVAKEKITEAARDLLQAAAGGGGRGGARRAPKAAA